VAVPRQDLRVPAAGFFSRAAGRARHWAEERVWRTRAGSRWLLRRDLRILDDFRSTDRGSVFASVERSIFSQNGEDGILVHLFDLLGVRDGIFVEVGAADGEQNCTRALAEAGWSGFWIEGDEDLVDHAAGIGLGGRVAVIQSMVAPSTIVQLLHRVGVPPRVDLLSLDIDSCDFWVLREVLAEFEATVVAVEVNGEHPWPWVLPQRRGSGPRSKGWDQSWNYGASLGAYDTLMSSFGYSLVGCDSQGVNAFFVRTDAVTAGMATGSWRSFYRPPTHRPGTLGHPRQSPATTSTPMVESQAVLDQVRFGAVEVIGASQRGPGERVVILVDVHNATASPLASAGDHPYRLSYRLLCEADGRDVTYGEPQRSRLASVVAPGAVRASGIEAILPETVGEYLVVPTVVQEGVMWRNLDSSEGVRISVRG